LSLTISEFGAVVTIHGRAPIYGHWLESLQARQHRPLAFGGLP
jgi:hypothetical protein